jgi:transcriptional regulator with XRE-family HTH domain
MKASNLRHTIRKVRKFKGLSIDFVAKEIGVQRYYLTNYENGKANITIDVLDRLLTYLCIDIVTKIID